MIVFILHPSSFTSLHPATDKKRQRHTLSKHNKNNLSHITSFSDPRFPAVSNFPPSEGRQTETDFNAARKLPNVFPGGCKTKKVARIHLVFRVGRFRHSYSNHLRRLDPTSYTMLRYVINVQARVHRTFSRVCDWKMFCGGKFFGLEWCVFVMEILWLFNDFV